MDKNILIEAALDDNLLLKELIPGENELTKKVRNQISSFARNTASRGALLLGPIGSGKSTIARVMALVRYLHFCKDDKRKQVIGNIKFDAPFRIDKHLLDFYEEMNLTGLVTTLAQSQLFGIAGKTATGVSERRGIFEQAIYGHSPKEKGSISAQITGGIVFLDEIGDLAPELQPLLLSVLTGTQIFRVGGEGDPQYGYEFNGSIIAATWKDPFSGPIRHDLLSRLTNYVIKLPGLNDRVDEIEEIIRIMVEDILSRHSNELGRLAGISSDYISVSKIRKEKERVLEFDDKNIKLLQKQNWGKRGDLRGLRQILERCFYEDISVQEALDQTGFNEIKNQTIVYDLTGQMIEELLNSEYSTPFSKGIRKIEVQTRKELAKRIKSRISPHVVGFQRNMLKYKRFYRFQAKTINR